MCSNSEENSDTVLLNEPAAKISSEDTDKADIIPLDGNRSLVVVMLVCGGPRNANEKIEMREFVPQIRLC